MGYISPTTFLPGATIFVQSSSTILGSQNLTATNQKMATARLLQVPNKTQLLSTIKECRDGKMAFSILQQVQLLEGAATVLDVDVFNTVMNMCQQSHENRTTLEVFDMMILIGKRVIPNNESFVTAFKACEKEGDITKSLDLLNQMASFKVRASSTAYLTPLRLHLKKKELDQAYDLLNTMTKTLDLQMNISVVNNLLREFANKGMYQQAVGTYHDVIVKKKLRPNVDTYNAIIHACNKANEFPTALIFFEKLKQDEHVMPNNGTYSAVISVLGRQRKWQEALQLFESVKSNAKVTPNVVTCNAAMNACAVSKRWTEALGILQWMQGHESKISPNKGSFATAIHACGRASQWEKAIAVFNSMESCGVSADLLVFNNVINVCDKAGKWKEALYFLKTMREQGVKPNVISYTAAISACRTADRWEEAVELFNDMIKGDVQPNVVTYTVVISACGKAGEWEKAFHLFHHMSRKGIVPNIITYNALITACANGYEPEKALDILNTMERAGVKPDVISYNAAISACEKAGQWEKALRLVNSMEKRGVKPDVVSYNSAISACKYDNDCERALYMLKSMEKRGVKPDVVSYNAAMSVCVKTGRYEDALHIFDKQMKVKDLISYNIAIEACSKASSHEFSHRALDILEDMRCDMVGIKPDVITFTSAIMACQHLKEDSSSKITRLFALMKSYGVSPNVTNFNFAMQSCDIAQDYKQLITLYHLMNENGIVPDLSTYSLVMKYWRKENQMDKGLAVFHESVKPLFDEQRKMKEVAHVDNWSALQLPLLKCYQEAIHLLIEKNNWKQCVSFLHEYIDIWGHDGLEYSQEVRMVLLYVLKDVVKVCASNGASDVACDLVDAMIHLVFNKGEQPSQETLTRLMMKDKESERKAFNILLVVLELTGRNDEAMRCWWERHCLTVKQAAGGDIVHLPPFNFYKNERMKSAYKTLPLGNDENINKIDLHGCSLPVARTVLRFFFKSFAQATAGETQDGESLIVDCNQDYYVITGQGLHSAEYQEVLASGIVDFLHNEYPCLDITAIPENPGRFLLKSSSLRDTFS